MQARDGGPERVAEDRGWNGFGSWCRYRSMCQNAITAIEVQADGKLLIAGAGSDESNNLQFGSSEYRWFQGADSCCHREGERYDPGHRLRLRGCRVCATAGEADAGCAGPDRLLEELIERARLNGAFAPQRLALCDVPSRQACGASGDGSRERA